MFPKIRLVQKSFFPESLDFNSQIILTEIQAALLDEIDILIFPELCLTGYLCHDAFLKDSFVEKSLKYLDKIVSQTKKITVILGFVSIDKTKITENGHFLRYNSAAVIRDQKIDFIAKKILLPEYDIFSEKRYFSSGEEVCMFSWNRLNIGLTVCEDLWDGNYQIKPIDELFEQGADLVINISSSPYTLGKFEERLRLVEKKAGKYHKPIVYCNQVGAQDGYDGQVLFDGQSFVLNGKSELSVLGKDFSEDVITLDLGGSLKGVKSADFLAQKEQESNLKYVQKALTLGIKEYYQQNKFTRIFLGLSGGIDSSLVAALAVQAVGKENVKGMFMPSAFSSSESREDSFQLAENLEIDCDELPITSVFDSFQEVLSAKFQQTGLDKTEENLQARIRGTLLMSLANKFNGLVLATGNKTELALGYCTLYGDMCGGLAPLGDVSKTLVYELADYINRTESKEIIPRRVVEKAPTAELRNNQTDEQALGASYEIISPLVDELINSETEDRVFAKDYPCELVDRMQKLINQNEFKRRQAPPAIKITKRAFGIGRRININRQNTGY
jgi:NAD+ synthetase